jgi:hypothetical protein
VELVVQPSGRLEEAEAALTDSRSIYRQPMHPVLALPPTRAWRWRLSRLLGGVRRGPGQESWTSEEFQNASNRELHYVLARAAILQASEAARQNAQTVADIAIAGDSWGLAYPSRTGNVACAQGDLAAARGLPVGL